MIGISASSLPCVKPTILLALLFQVHSLDQQTWMKHIPDSKKLCQLLIPGTHNSGSYGNIFGIGQTQDWNIKEQLENGIRFFDVRLAKNTSPNDFEVIHGFLRLGSFKKLIMSPVTNFLKENPSEFIFMRIINYKFDFEAEIRLQHDFIKNLEYRFYQNVFTSSTLTGQVCLIKDFCVSKNSSR